MKRFTRRSLSIRVIVLLVVTGCILFSARSAQSLHTSARESDEREAVLAVAQKAAVTFTTYDYRELDSTFDALLAMGTEDFRSTFGQAVDQLRPLMKREKARSTGTVVASALADETTDGATAVLVTMNVTVKGLSTKKGKERQFRLRLRLQHAGDEWLLEEIGTVS
ncbi:hypothetical protein [Nocardioides stalactiti]|uniref:hypothetical protein n=1 Tax=Nocardioides stalactiti TaxID=2755356 RepID=UPI0016036AEC|nr:hypothetical protein [Nocardioides stalactiti]